MKLYIKRNQESGMLGGISFSVTSRVELSPEEMDLVKKYKAHKTVILTKQHPIFGTLTYKIEDLINGVKSKCKDITEIIDSENIVKRNLSKF